MKTVYKYQLNHQNKNIKNIIKMPVGAKILSMQTLKGKPCIWALVETDNQNITKEFIIYGTGDKINESIIQAYVGTYKVLDGTFVYHVFETNL